jgi:hypothetical protein
LRETETERDRERERQRETEGERERESEIVTETERRRLHTACMNEDERAIARLGSRRKQESHRIVASRKEEGGKREAGRIQ